MNTFKRKALFAAVVAGLGVAGSAEAVFIAPNKTGQALVYPYYTVQRAGNNEWNTYISVVNTTPDAKALKVRILEGRTSQEVLDFNLFLSANDVWTAAIVPSDATDTSGARILTRDNSCTAPAIPNAGQPFRNAQYAGQIAALGRGLDRTREGYIEIIEMASLTGDTAIAVTHDAAGVPDDCSVVQVASTANIILDSLPPTGGLTGTGTLINVNSGLDAGYKPDALDAFRDTFQVTGPGFTGPALIDATPPTSVVFNSGFSGSAAGSIFATVYRSEFVGVTGGVPSGALAVASVFMHEAIMNEYVLDTDTLSRTDWVVTQPLKADFVTSATAFAPYSSVLRTGGACEEIEFSFFNREEGGAQAGGIDFSPISITPSSICWESTVISIRNGEDHMPVDPAGSVISGVLGSRNTTAININDDYQNGWASLRFVGANATGVGIVADPAFSDKVSVGSDRYFAAAPGSAPVSLNPTVFFGLPATGFMIRTFNNNTTTCDGGACARNYASLFDHAYRNLIGD